MKTPLFLTDIERRFSKMEMFTQSFTWTMEGTFIESKSKFTDPTVA